MSKIGEKVSKLDDSRFHSPDHPCCSHGKSTKRQDYRNDSSRLSLVDANRSTG